MSIRLITVINVFQGYCDVMQMNILLIIYFFFSSIPQELMSLLRSKGAEALDVSSSEESEDSDGDDNEVSF